MSYLYNLSVTSEVSIYKTKEELLEYFNTHYEKLTKARLNRTNATVYIIANIGGWVTFITDYEVIRQAWIQEMTIIK